MGRPHHVPAPCPSGASPGSVGTDGSGIVERTSSTVRRWAITLPAAVLLGLTVPAGVAWAGPPAAEGSLVSEPLAVPGGTGPGNQTDPHLSGSLLVFTAVEDGGSAIRWVDLATGSGATIDNTGARDSLPDVAGDLVVFRRVHVDGPTTRPIMVVDVTAPELGAREVAPEEGARRAFPSIGGTTVAFMQFVTGSSTESEVCVADAVATAAPAVCLTADSTMSNRDPHVSPDGSTVAWTKCQTTGLGCDVYVARRAADGTWLPPTQLTDSSGEDILPETDGTVVTYASNAGGDYDIWYEDVDGSQERQLVLADAPGSIETNPTISGGSILFERELPGSLDADLYLYRLATGELLRVTETADADETLNALSLSASGELWVAWAQADGLAPGQNDIHAARAQLDDGSSEPPALSLPADLTVDATGPDGAAVTYAASSEGATVTCEPASGATFPIGTTTVGCTAVDGHGATTAGSFDVTVRGRAAISWPTCSWP